MALIKYKTRIKIEDIYDRVDTGTLFSYYFGNFKFSKCYPSVFRTDNNPSTGFYISKKGEIIYNDISTGEKLNIFAFVAKKYNISYGKAIEKVACDFGIIPCKGLKAIDPVEFKKSINLADQLKKETVIDIVYDDWNAGSLAYWQQYRIGRQELTDEDVYPVKKLIINGVIIPNIRYNLRFAYILNFKDKCYKKIYEPQAEKEYRWFQNVPIYLPYGFDRLKYETDTLIIQKSQKDRIITKKFHPDVIGIQNESIAALRDTTLSFLKKKYKRIVCVFDNDKRGIEACEEYRQRGCEAYHLPIELLEKGVKDFGDLVKTYGLTAAERWLKKENII